MRTTPFLALALLAFAPLTPLASAANNCGDTLSFVGGTPATASSGTVTIQATFQDAPDHCGLDTWSFTFHRNGVYFSGPWNDLGSYTTSGSTYVITADAILDDAIWTVSVSATENCCNTVGLTGATGSGSWTITVGGSTPTACSDGVDNDGDGVADVSDPGCASPADTSERGAAECDDGLDNDFDGQSDYPADVACSGPADDSETADCPETLPEVQFCITTGEPLTPQLEIVEVVDGDLHRVAGYLDVYRVLVPVVGAVQIPCVTLIVDGSETNGCDGVGTFVSRSATLVDTYVRESEVEQRPLPGGVRVCEAEITLLVMDFGLPATQGYALC